MQPQSGGRFTLRFLARDAAEARFAVDLATPAGQWAGEAAISLGEGEVRWGAWTGPEESPPEWLCHYAHAALRSAWRAQGEQGWPRRLTRWREAPDPGRAERDGDAKR